MGNLWTDAFNPLFPWDCRSNPHVSQNDVLCCCAPPKVVARVMRMMEHTSNHVLLVTRFDSSLPARPCTAIAAGIPPGDIWCGDQRLGGPGGPVGSHPDWWKDDASRVSVLTTVLVAAGNAPQAVSEAIRGRWAPTSDLTEPAARLESGFEEWANWLRSRGHGVFDFPRQALTNFTHHVASTGKPSHTKLFTTAVATFCQFAFGFDMLNPGGSRDDVAHHLRQKTQAAAPKQSRPSCSGG